MKIWFSCMLLCVCCGIRAQHYVKMADRLMQAVVYGQMEDVRPFLAHYGDSLSDFQRCFLSWHVARQDNDIQRTVVLTDSLMACPEMDGEWICLLASPRIGQLRERGSITELADYTEHIWSARQHADSLGYYETALDRMRVWVRRAGNGSADACALWTACLQGRLWDLWIGRKDPVPSSLEPFARDWFRLLWARRYGSYRQIEDAVDRMECLHWDVLSPGERLDVLQARCFHLLHQGRYAELAAVGDKVASAGVRGNAADGWGITHWVQMGQALQGTPRPSVERPADDCIVPLTGDGWPMMLPCRLNGVQIDSITLDTGSPVTLLDSLDAARCGVRLLPLNLTAISYLGTHACRLGVVDSLRVGDIVFRNRRVYVLSDRTKVLPGGIRSVLGMAELRDLDAVDFCSGRLVFPYIPSAVQEQGPNFYFNEFNAILASLYHGGKTYTFFLDTGAASDFVCSGAFSPDSVDTSAFELTGDFGTLYQTVQLHDGNGDGFDGQLGMPFVERFERLRVDFRSMRVEGEGVKETPFRILERLICAGDWFALERRQAEWSGGNSRLIALGGLFVEMGKNRPDSLLKCIARSEDLLLEMLGDRNLRALRVQAQTECGDYAGAAVLLKSYLPVAGEEDRLSVVERLAMLEALVGTPPVEMEYNRSWKPIPGKLDTDGRLSLRAKANGKKMVWEVSPERDYCRLTPEDARRLGVRKLLEDHTLKGDTLSVAVLDELRLGAVTMRNVVCYVDSDLSVSQLGLSVLRRLPLFRLSGDGLYWTTESVPDVPIRVDGNVLLSEVWAGDTCMVAEWHGGQAVYKEALLENASLRVGCCLLPSDVWAAAGPKDGGHPIAYTTFGIGAMLRAGIGLVFDFNRMRMGLVTD